MDFDAHNRSGLSLGGDHWVHLEYLLPDGKMISYPRHEEAPEGAIFIGLMDHHKNPEGEWCGGWIGFENVPEATPTYMRYTGHPARHQLVSKEPLHVEPSLGCKRCPSHGHIHGGKWVPVGGEEPS